MVGDETDEEAGDDFGAGSGGDVRDGGVDDCGGEDTSRKETILGDSQHSIWAKNTPTLTPTDDHLCSTADTSISGIVSGRGGAVCLFSFHFLSHTFNFSSVCVCLCVCDRSALRPGPLSPSVHYIATTATGRFFFFFSRYFDVSPPAARIQFRSNNLVVFVALDRLKSSGNDDYPG